MHLALWARGHMHICLVPVTLYAPERQRVLPYAVPDGARLLVHLFEII